jgi:O-antigen/teichoic acid export membrane protein
LTNSKIRINQFIQNNIFFLIIINLGNFLNFISQFFLSRNLDSDNFGLYVTCLNLLSIFTTITIVSPIIIRNYFNIKDKLIMNNFILLKKILIYYFIYWLFTCIILILFRNYFNNILKIDHNYIIFFFIITTASINIMSILYGLFISINRYKTGALINSLNPFLRFLLLIIFFYFISKEATNLIFTTLYASLIVIIVSFIFLLYGYKEIFTKLISVKIKDLIIPSFANFFFYILIFSLIYNIDNLIVRYLYQETISAEYISINLVSKIIYFFVIGISPFLFSEIKKYKNKIPLYISLLITLLIGFLYLIAIFFYQKEIINLIFDGKYIDNSNILIKLTIANIFFAMLYFLILGKLAVKNYFSLLILFITACIYILVLFTIDNNLGNLSNIVLLFSIIFTLIMFFDFKLINKILYKTK